ncbi:hypothetical protein GPK34_01890 [Secundilactobacillus kimchicus]|uniref:hypothetical protein n=1 Tax=Secundilactobacillus kimchicus TaxID=528209 RepID=UPI000704A509|nr:hypothetical protein [Secundilactobacillus kimchicus]MBT9670790.1 hypothetical protein [Secundilactobacillus kimchicus]
MLITILMLLLTAINLFLGWYLFTHRNRPFLVFHPEKNAGLASLTKFSGLALTVMGVVALVATVIQNNVFISIVLIFDIILVLVVQMIFVSFFPKQ